MLLRPSLFGFEVRGEAIISQSGDACPVVFYPVIPQPHYKLLKGNIFTSQAVGV